MRTRNAARLLALAGALLPASLPTWAADRAGEALHLRLMHDSSAAQPWQVGIYGEAAEYCQPAVKRVALDGADLSIELRAPSTGCNPARTVPFVLKARPAAASPLLDGRVYRVRVYSEVGGISSLSAFHLVDTGPGRAMGPESGFWWSVVDEDAGTSPSRSTGLNVEAQGDRLAVGVYGFDDAGAPTWYFGSTRMSGRIASVSLLALAGGDPLFSPGGSQPAAQPGPRLELEFLSPARARAWLVRSVDGYDVAVRALTVSRSRFAGEQAAIGSGRWVLVSDDDSPPRQFDFSSPSRADADTVHLADAGHDATLACSGGNDSNLPRRCHLFVADVELADFDRIGVDRFVGKRIDGTTARLLRVQPQP